MNEDHHPVGRPSGESGTMTPPINSVSDELIRTGDALATAAFNLAQPSSGLSDDVRSSLKRCQEEWDAARRAANTPVDGVAWEQAARTFLSGDDFEALQSLAVAFAEDQAAGVDTSLKPASPALPSQVVGAALTAYELQVLLGTSISGCNMEADRTFDLPAAWARLKAIGLIDRADGLAIATDKGLARIQACLTSPAAEPVAWLNPDNGAIAKQQTRNNTVPLYTHSASREVTDPLDALAKHPSWEIDYGPSVPNDEESDYAWRVFEVSGNVNDREWTLLGFGDTPRAALLAALPEREVE